MRLFIAEKPSLARAIADALPLPHKRTSQYIECGDGNVVAWCAGHILQTAPPEAYAPEYKRWALEHLPIAPSTWKMEVTTPELLKTIKRLLKVATRVVHAGDPDREGQLLVDEVIEFLGYRGPVDRILINDLNRDAISRALQSLKPNASYKTLSHSALARQRADWLYGMNMTRLYTLLGRTSGNSGLLSVGRVQTPLLGLIVARDLAIESFKPAPYFAVNATFCTQKGATFHAVWKGAASAAGVERDRPMLSERIAQEMRTRIEGRAGVVASVSRDRKTEAPPLPYSLADLQIDAGRRLGLSAQHVLDACQSLYETHRLTTYPRSDCSYLPAAHLADAPNVLATISAHAPQLQVLATKVDLSIRSKAWDDKKITAHHAIVPTVKRGTPDRLSAVESAVFDLISRRYLAQFFPSFEYLLTTIQIAIEGETFGATGRQVLNVGWRAISDNKNREPKEGETILPEVEEGDSVTVTNVVVTEKKTQPLRPFDDASLMQAMCNVAKFVTDAKAKKILTESDGIGTPATRASIIERLFARGYVTRVHKTIVSTVTGRELIKSLPAVATTPDMTATWEAGLSAIHQGSQTLDAFLARITSQLTELVAAGKRQGSIAVRHLSQGRRVAAAPRPRRSRPRSTV